MIGARDLAFPRINLLSWYLFIAGGAASCVRMFAGGVDTGWTFYTPLSSDYSKGHVVLAVTGVFIAGFSSIADRPQFHRHHPSAARARHDLVPDADLPVVAVLHAA